MPTIHQPKHERLAPLRAVADPRFERAVRPSSHRRSPSGSREPCSRRSRFRVRLPRAGTRSADCRLAGRCRRAAVAFDDAQEFEGDHPIALGVRDTASIAPPAGGVHRSSMLTGPPPPDHVAGQPRHLRNRRAHRRRRLRTQGAASQRQQPQDEDAEISSERPPRPDQRGRRLAHPPGGPVLEQMRRADYALVAMHFDESPPIPELGRRSCCHLDARGRCPADWRPPRAGAAGRLSRAGDAVRRSLRTALRRRDPERSGGPGVRRPTDAAADAARPERRGLGVRFRPGSAAAVLHMPQRELLGATLGVDALDAACSSTLRDIRDASRSPRRCRHPRRSAPWRRGSIRAWCRSAGARGRRRDPPPAGQTASMLSPRRSASRVGIWSAASTRTSEFRRSAGAHRPLSARAAHAAAPSGSGVTTAR